MTAKLCIAQNPDADALLERDPFALLLGMMLDQQIPMEVAFSGPKKVLDRMGELSPRAIAEADPEAFHKVMSTPPAVHRFHGAMSTRVQAFCQAIVDNYEGDAELIWTRDKPTAAEVVRRLKELPGFGEQKAKIFVALLGKQRGVALYAWRKVTGDYGKPNTRRSVADVTDSVSLKEVRQFKKAAKAAAGIVTVSGWEQQRRAKKAAEDAGADGVVG